MSQAGGNCQIKLLSLQSIRLSTSTDMLTAPSHNSTLPTIGRDNIKESRVDVQVNEKKSKMVSKKVKHGKERRKESLRTLVPMFQSSQLGHLCLIGFGVNPTFQALMCCI